MLLLSPKLYVSLYRKDQSASGLCRLVYVALIFWQYTVDKMGDQSKLNIDLGMKISFIRSLPSPTLATKKKIDTISWPQDTNSILRPQVTILRPRNSILRPRVTI